MVRVCAEKSTFLFAMPNFLRGMARAVDIGATMNLYNESPNAKIADARALAADWKQIGDNMREVIDEHETTEQTK